MTPELKNLDDAAKAAFPQEFADGRLNKNGGVYNCRRKKLANPPPPPALPPWSEHAWSNAKDYYVKNYGTVEGKALGTRFAAWARSTGLAAEVYWQVPGHFNHVHVTAKPAKNFDGKQIPPCAGGPEPEDDVYKQFVEGIVTGWAEDPVKTRHEFDRLKQEGKLGGSIDYWINLLSTPSDPAWLGFYARTELSSW